MDNLENVIQEFNCLPSDGAPQTEPLTFQSKGRGFESPRLHQGFNRQNLSFSQLVDNLLWFIGLSYHTISPLFSCSLTL